MPYIRVDLVVLAYLRERQVGAESHNDTLRRNLGPPPASPSAEPAPTIPGALMPLLAAGILTAGDTLTWRRPRRGEVHTATVDEAGRLVTADGGVFLTPDTCASAIVGYPCKGWPVWRTATGATLQRLLAQATT